MGGQATDPLGDVRPGTRPSWWLRDALALDPGAPVAPLTGDTIAFLFKDRTSLINS